MRSALFRFIDTRRGFVGLLFGLVLLSAFLRVLFISHPPTPVFDEVYSPAFAWKFLQGEEFFDVHPFLTQFPQVVGLLLFGNTPLGWRFSAWLWGSFFIAGIGVYASALTGERRVGILASLLAVLDIAFFVYGRTGLPDMFLLATFVWAMAFFFFSARVQRPLHAMFAALASGILLGNLVATKWLGLGAIALIWVWIGFAWLGNRQLDFAKATPGKQAIGSRDGTVTPVAHAPWPMPRIQRWLLPVMFLLVPLGVYLLWTIPVVGVPGVVRPAVGKELFQGSCTLRGSTQVPPPTTWLGRVRHWHCTVWNYHAYLTATHPYGSPWWSWPILQHPVLFHLDTSVKPALRITATGNPVLWWGGFAVLVGTGALLLLHAFRRASSHATSELLSVDRVDLWLVLGILGFWLPWAFIERVAFHYHYFLSFTLTIILLARWLMRWEQHPAYRIAVIGFLLTAAVGFIYLYPSATALSAPWLR